MQLKTTIPFVDLRGKTAIDLLRAYPDKANALVSAARRTYGGWSNAASALLLPLADKRSHRWLKHTKNPYLHEIESFAEILGSRGIYALNVAYEWGCTSGVYRANENVLLLRVLDWPFPALGRHVVVALQSTRAGEYYNVTWPGVSGVYNAMAPQRFAATLNMAPMRMHNYGKAGSWLKNRLLLAKENSLPPAHLLRQVFEQAGDYEEAKQMLMQIPIAAPVIYVLAGTKAGEGCVIERLENCAELHELGAQQSVSASNHFNSALAQLGMGWYPREADSAGRYKQSCGLQGDEMAEPHFEWLRAPIINQFTRLCVAASAQSGRLTVQGFEGSMQVTDVFHLEAQPNSLQEEVYGTC